MGLCQPYRTGIFGLCSIRPHPMPVSFMLYHIVFAHLNVLFLWFNFNFFYTEEWQTINTECSSRAKYNTFLNTLYILPYSILETQLLSSFYQQGVIKLNVRKPWFKPGGPDSESAWSLPCIASLCRANRFVWIVFVFLTEVIHLNAHTTGISAVIWECDWKLVASHSRTQACFPSGPRPPHRWLDMSTAAQCWEEGWEHTFQSDKN